MTIKQQGGIFGRNPTFNDLTVEGTFTTSGATETSGDLSLNDSTLNITANRPQIFLKEQDRANNNVRLECQNDNFNIAYVDDDNLNNVTRFFVEMNTGDAKIVSGNLIIGTSGKGIDFSATSGTGTSELFDDYEEGTFTPAIEGESSNPTISYSTQYGAYTKIGRVVNFSIIINISSISGGSGNVKIVGLPFTAGLSSSPFPATTEVDGVTFGSGYTSLTYRPLTGQTWGRLNQFGSGLSSNATTIAQLSSSAGVKITGSYMV